MPRRLLRSGSRWLLRWLYLIHRWIGIATCLLFAIWFISGVVMMYVAFPGLSDAERRGFLPAVDWPAVQLAPDAALRLAGQQDWPRSLRLEMLGAEPVYRIQPYSGAALAVSARDGRVITSFNAAEAEAAMQARFPAARFVETVERDQWSVTARFNPHRPLHVLALNDAAFTELYVSAVSGEIVLDTTRRERFWNWLGSIPHWIYFTPLRADAPLWRDVVLWLSGISIVVAVSGIWIGIQRIRLRRRYARDRLSPYRGWMLWHHWAGLIGSVTLLAWIVSGWISMNPNAWFSSRNLPPEALQRYAAAPDLDFPLPLIAQAGVYELRFGWLGGQPVLQYLGPQGLLAVRPVPAADQMLRAARTLLPMARPVLQEMLHAEDAYWYSHHHRRVLPVLRIGFDDPAATWFHIDPRNGDILGSMDATRRGYRWWFNALHSFDFAFLRHYPPTWEIVLWGFSLIGLVASASGVVIGWRRLRRNLSG